MLTTCQKQPVQKSETPLEIGECQILNEELNHQVLSSIQETGYFMLDCQIVVKVDESGKVELEGIVPSYFQKQQAQLAAMSNEGIKCLYNNIEVL